ncbi:MAG TPA: hypothetical protein VKP30_31210 [Polyangiaceae bacterium]|nr:hypothetical protein [Polyangiaceae bacterium]
MPPLALPELGRVSERVQGAAQRMNSTGCAGNPEDCGPLRLCGLAVINSFALAPTPLEFVASAQYVCGLGRNCDEQTPISRLCDERVGVGA